MQLAKSHLRVDFPDDDLLITGLITAARQYAEKRTNRAFYTQTWLRTLDFFPLYGRVDATRAPSERDNWPYGTWYWNRVTIDLPHNRVQSVTSITYYDGNGNQQTLPSDSYNVDVTSLPARITPAQGMFWPIVNNYVPGSVQITYVAGSYGDGVEINTIPMTLVQAMLMLIGHWYEHRESASEISIKNVPMAVDALLEIEKIHIVGYR
ncbi:head-tail connector protein [Tunturiibacter psychrotolerans]|uniref:head-tail connector protein n=1 Tax=Tunturiibacter psychrotolerans TaxID=3069686 RepID=UPI003D1DB02A